jgi:hypothetical protein
MKRIFLKYQMVPEGKDYATEEDTGNRRLSYVERRGGASVKGHGADRSVAAPVSARGTVA